MSATMSATLTTRPVRLACVALRCERCGVMASPEEIERTPAGHFRCTDQARCRYRRDQHRRIADALRAGDAGEVAA